MDSKKIIVAALALFATLATTAAQGADKPPVGKKQSISDYISSRIINPERIEQVTKAADDKIGFINNEELLQRLDVQDSITPETTDLLGESIDLNTGSLSFSNTDVSIPGNSQLPVQISRNFKGHQLPFNSELEFGNWSLDIPHISSTILQYPSLSGYSGPWGEGLACSKENIDEWNGFMPYEYWNGDSLNVPGQTGDKLLFNDNTLADTTGFARITKSGWRVKCIASTTWAGEAFEVHAPDGTIYLMDQLRLISVGELKRQNRYQVQMAVSIVTDRFGNTVNYSYDSEGKLTSIVASDGRQITLEYTYAYPHDNFISAIQTNSRRWTYQYTGSYHLASVTRPDGKSWTYNLSALGSVKAATTTDGYHGIDECEPYTPGIGAQTSWDISLIHPNGTRGDFVLKQVRHGRSNVDKQRRYSGSVDTGDVDMINKCFNTLAISTKTLVGPGLSGNTTWTYDYSENAGFFSDETAIGSVTGLSASYLTSHNLTPHDYRRSQVTAPMAQSPNTFTTVTIPA